ncbi:hypothetical protein J2X16_001133 [Pelomonas aquatica]|uniref:O-antigen ligase domain-containing protein n=1 Tax=Pelomonas aquatica TaxID=431058 RepID=A0ABU1Z5C4_9BURK|nr:hypothetical protein [Pelomonas aquatica]MDR7295812.1 hypothetical protein [Pelomonas aquatica]
MTDTFGGAVQGVFPAALLMRGLLIVVFLLWALQGRGVKADFRQMITASLLYFCVFFFLHFLIDFNAAAVSLEASATLRLLYAPLLACYVAACLTTGLLLAEDARRVILAYGWLILLSLLLGQITGLGGAIGGRGLEAGKGFMIGANEVGLMLLLTCPVVVADLQRRLRWTALVAIVALPLYGWAAVYVFTKSSLFVPVVCAAAIFALCQRAGGWSLRIAYLLLIAGGAVAVSAALSQLDLILTFAQSTFFRSLFDDGMIVFLFRGRQDYIEAIYPRLAGHEFSALFWIFGAGEFHVRAISEAPLMLLRGEGTTFEMDVFDLIACYGIVGTTVYAVLLRRAMAPIARAGLGWPAVLAVGAVFIHGFMAGHVVFSPQVMTLLILLAAASTAAALRNPIPAPSPAEAPATPPLHALHP